ncbi:MAG: hypothetical protein NW203_01785 [Hyphomonadaceae bacterium]|nr:hypothetical protein [Hyphomonadaceae bacterium]
MYVVLLQAKGDSAADPVAAALGSRLLARVILGERRADIALGHVTAVVVWSAAAAAAPDDLVAMCARARSVIVVRAEDAPAPPAPLAQAALVDWRSGGLPALLQKLDAVAEPRAAEPRRGGASMLAGALAVAGAIAPSASAAATASPRVVEAARNGGRATRQETQIAHAEAQAIVAAAPPITEIDVDRLAPPAPFDPETASAALLKHAPRQTIDLPAPAPRKLRIFDFGAFSLRP